MEHNLIASSLTQPTEHFITSTQRLQVIPSHFAGTPHLPPTLVAVPVWEQLLVPGCVVEDTSDHKGAFPQLVMSSSS